MNFSQPQNMQYFQLFLGEQKLGGWQAKFRVQKTFDRRRRREMQTQSDCELASLAKDVVGRRLSVYLNGSFVFQGYKGLS